MKVTIFGASGLLGQDLMQVWTGDEITGLGSRDADIREYDQVARAVEKTRPDWIVLSAAYTDVDGCESHQDLAFAVNATGAANVARAAKESGARLLHVSTDYVFDGASATPYEADHPRAPRSVYGRSKAEGEERILEILAEACIARTSWLFGRGGKCFPDTILKLAATRPIATPVSAAQPISTAAVAPKAPTSEFVFIEDKDPKAMPGPAGARAAAGPPGKRAKLRPGRQVNARTRVKAKTLEETLEILGAGQLEVDDGRGPTINDSGSRRVRGDGAKGAKSSRIGRLLERLSERLSG